MVIGGGAVAERKALGLINANADVTIISPTLTPALDAAKTDGRITHVKRRFRASDIDGAAIVVAATDDAKVNRSVARAAGDGVLLNIVDDPSLCTFIVPSVIRAGAFTIAISTGGASPSAAKAMRLKIEGALGTGALK